MVSVIMPVYNAESFVKEAIESILKQTYSKLELLIIDDISTDCTMEVVHAIKDDRIRILKNDRNHGVAYSRNRGLEECKGEYIAIMDDDDIAMPYRFEMQVKFLQQNQHIDVVGGKTQFIDEQGNIVRGANKAYYNPKYIKALFLFRNEFCNSEVMFRRKSLGDLRYEDGCLGMEDFKFWIQLSKYAPMYMIDEVFLKHRIHESSITTQMMEQKSLARKKKYAELQEFSWKLSGISLSKDEMLVLHRYFDENMGNTCETIQELKRFYETLGKFLMQCKKLDFYDEIQIFCKKELMRQSRRVPSWWE